MKNLAMVMVLAFAVVLLPVAATAYYTPTPVVTTPYWCGSYYSSYPCNYSGTSVASNYNYGYNNAYTNYSASAYGSYLPAQNQNYTGSNYTQYPYTEYSASQYPSNYNYSYGNSTYNNQGYQYYDQAYRSIYNNTYTYCYQGTVNGPTYYYPCSSNPLTAPRTSMGTQSQSQYPQYNQSGYYYY